MIRKRYGLGIVLLISLVFLILGTQTAFAAEIVSTSDVTVCCEKTQSGLYCQNAPIEECSSEVNPNTNEFYKQAPTNCESTSFCREGTCVDSIEGTCSGNTPELVCNNDGGVWFLEEPAQCSLGCCVLGDQAAFVTLTRCKALSADLGLQTNYRNDIQDETQCVLSVAGQEKGACVFDFEFERTCRFTTRSICSQGIDTTGVEGTSTISGEFYPDRLCTDEELGTNCGPTENTICVPGKDEVYFVDTCGNAGNVYDAAKTFNRDSEYWANVKTKAESCGADSDNANDVDCGNCNYLLGSFCRDASKENANPRMGDYICADLNCQDTSNGEDYKHGESWCINSDIGTVDLGDNSVGSRFFRHLCINGEEVVESCDDFRQQTCVEDEIETSLGTFSQAACVVNRWQECFVQDDKEDCENTDRRDCLWKEGKFDVVTLNKSQKKGVCVPSNSPGFKFWEGEETLSICAQGNAQCIVTFEKSLFGDEECSDNCECLKDSWEKDHAELCSALGDCGPGINWQGQAGFKKGYEVDVTKLKERE
ncbi:hypothetical protein CMI45_03040 [Candidatus Pacearchaeota archaeon]|nr:hypothetical protein [Candidatus Pacearchaeota archaeon]|tara:strand:+ start:2645 stop:4255 length:1611 start_codon:yes stop_codon:yes gene_type:complete